MMTMLLNALVLFIVIAVLSGVVILCVYAGFHLGWWVADTVSKLVGRKMMYRLLANVEYTNGDFERRVIEDFIEKKEAEASALVNNAAYEEIAYMIEHVKSIHYEVRALE